MAACQPIRTATGTGEQRRQRPGPRQATPTQHYRYHRADRYARHREQPRRPHEFRQAHDRRHRHDPLSPTGQRCPTNPSRRPAAISTHPLPTLWTGQKASSLIKYSLECTESLGPEPRPPAPPRPYRARPLTPVTHDVGAGSAAGRDLKPRRGGRSGWTGDPQRSPGCAARLALSESFRRSDNETAEQPNRASAPCANPKHLPPARHGTRERGARGGSRRTRIAPVPADPRECLWRHGSRWPGRRADDRVRAIGVTGAEEG